MRAGLVSAELQRHCKHCGRIALRDREVCLRHSGRAGSPNPGPAVIAARAVQRVERAGLVPGGLSQLSQWRELGRVKFAPKFLLRLALLRAWDNRTTNVRAWQTLLREVRDNAAQG